ncbi:MAG TPA: phosphate ABC transporter permease subunit PstC [Chitinophagales bacterium]|nr:phosphate ABC transporter permease subunit PstC [Chitinophagales bacterium]
MSSFRNKYILWQEKAFRFSLSFSSVILLLILLGFFFTLLMASIPSIRALGWRFVYSQTWNPVTDDYGAFPFLVGTLLTSLLALIIAMPFSLAIGLFLGEYYTEGRVSQFFKNVIELLAGIPSVIYGFWGLFVLVPVIRVLETKIGVTPYGIGLFTASFILAIMILPYAVSLTRQVITMVPGHLKEAAYSLGATRYEVIRKVVLPFSRSGIFAGILLALGRALGETMAVTMLIGNTHALPSSIFAPSNTMASIIANEFSEATGVVYTSALIEMALMLFVVTTIVNIIGRQIIKRFEYDEK